MLQVEAVTLTTELQSGLIQTAGKSGLNLFLICHPMTQMKACGLMKMRFSCSDSDAAGRLGVFIVTIHNTSSVQNV